MHNQSVVASGDFVYQSVVRDIRPPTPTYIKTPSPLVPGSPQKPTLAISPEVTLFSFIPVESQRPSEPNSTTPLTRVMNIIQQSRATPPPAHPPSSTSQPSKPIQPHTLPSAYLPTAHSRLSSINPLRPSLTPTYTRPSPAPTTTAIYPPPEPKTTTVYPTLEPIKVPLLRVGKAVSPLTSMRKRTSRLLRGSKYTMINGIRTKPRFTNLVSTDERAGNEYETVPMGMRDAATRVKDREWSKVVLGKSKHYEQRHKLKFKLKYALFKIKHGVEDKPFKDVLEQFREFGTSECGDEEEEVVCDSGPPTPDSLPDQCGLSAMEIDDETQEAALILGAMRHWS
ncbi:hypothetical protein HK097_005263 [Rhizophlyctis rosea]|uniref:Uncharacterized protein n=1 Tax=Rhizophlyctis rosea TaxID=64517 RepID=A0AAD5X2J2_9FUNG|nr:hypothetical protein HK097_005263 [Rhizophlyctis rosea]